MTTITFGGGPSLEARKNFSNLKYGAQVPGYRGYIHQLKYNNGHTYGEQTHLLASRNDLGRSRSAAPNESSYSKSFDFESGTLRHSFKNDLPRANGSNKLTDTMIPGYTGYIPSRKFDFSDTYKVECDTCIDNFLTNKKEKLKKNQDIVSDVFAQPKHNQVSSDSEVKTLLDNYIDNHPTVGSLKSDRREFTEPPIPGYTGHIPKIVPTALGLGARYHETTKKGLDRFKNDFVRYSANRSNTFSDELSNNNDVSGNYFEDGNAANTKKIYVKPGMVPKYTGYVHGRKFQFGSTYGNSTRDLPVCSHDYKNFGDYLEKYPPKTATC